MVLLPAAGKELRQGTRTSPRAVYNPVYAEATRGGDKETH